MSDREKALLIQVEMERMAKEAKLPFVCLIGIPDEQGMTRASLGLNGADDVCAGNRLFFYEHFGDYMLKLHHGAARAPEGG